MRKPLTTSNATTDITPKEFLLGNPKYLYRSTGVALGQMRRFSIGMGKNLHNLPAIGSQLLNPLTYKNWYLTPPTFSKPDK